MLDISTPHLRRLASGWLKASPTRRPERIVALCDHLFASAHHDEKTLASLILGYSQKTRRTVTPEQLEGWLDKLVGWAEVDALCSNVFQPEDLLDDWSRWAALLRRLSMDANANKRRASLVLLTGPVRKDADRRRLDAALGAVRAAQGERSILITKAVSWLLRTLLAHHRTAVEDYLHTQKDALPPIARRELSIKLRTGRK